MCRANGELRSLQGKPKKVHLGRQSNTREPDSPRRSAVQLAGRHRGSRSSGMAAAESELAALGGEQGSNSRTEMRPRNPHNTMRSADVYLDLLPPSAGLACPDATDQVSSPAECVSHSSEDRKSEIKDQQVDVRRELSPWAAEGRFLSVSSHGLSSACVWRERREGRT